jgi:hypothetical protein
LPTPNCCFRGQVHSSIPRTRLRRVIRRLAAFLARQAVEELIDTRCATLCDFPVVVGTTKAKLAVLKSLDTTPAGGILIDAWHQLTGFCHQHAYQLAPTVAEVREQCLAVERACLANVSPEGEADHSG